MPDPHTLPFRRLALDAGAAIMDVYRRDDRGVRAKDDASPVTDADLAADRILHAGLRAAFPDVPIVTEERSDSHGVGASDFLIVDPLDGTKEFVHRRGEFTVNVARVVDGVPVAGVVYAPAKGRLFYTDGSGRAVEEAGPFDRDAPGPTTELHVRQADDAALVVVASKSHRSPELEDYIARYRVADSRAAGSSLKFCLVAAGEADFYPRLGRTMEWDTAAGDAVVRAAGGVTLSADGHEPLRYGKPGYENPHFLVCGAGVTLRTD
ncbi:3'(2'),5'-bisphosphate nucleotidase CysQ [Jannaschia sp. LMIT008]|uniref:3'(2'),5'-bisphosphate nucleotidase CysQ n=1 Tax=Jannaschia maritima TaxID=3032585 RepID=UPI0028120291|nr:3'(2'),5'-bisphosphate nucleotidase CysQ [Jannaschia sp. LMIT008]